MLTVTEAAQEQVAAYFKTNQLRPIRIFLHNGGCGGPQIAMALDEKRPTDTDFEVAGITYLVDPAFLEQAQPITIDHNGAGFDIQTSLVLEPSGCGSCGCSGNCG